MMERRLATILALDVVNFSKLMSEDEIRTLKNLGTARALIDASIDEYEGRIFNTAGDSVLAEFLSPVKALECAVKIQNATKVKNSELADSDKMDFRMFSLPLRTVCLTLLTGSSDVNFAQALTAVLSKYLAISCLRVS